MIMLLLSKDDCVIAAYRGLFLRSLPARSPLFSRIDCYFFGVTIFSLVGLALSPRYSETVPKFYYVCSNTLCAGSGNWINPFEFVAIPIVSSVLVLIFGVSMFYVVYCIRNNCFYLLFITSTCISLAFFLLGKFLEVKFLTFFPGLIGVLTLPLCIPPLLLWLSVSNFILKLFLALVVLILRFVMTSDSRDIPPCIIFWFKASLKWLSSLVGLA